MEPTLFGAMKRYWWVVVTLALCGALLAWSVHQTFARDWSATTTMLVDNPQNSALFNRDGATSPERYTADQVAILESDPVAERALEIAQAESDSTTLELNDITTGIEVESGLDSGSISVTASHPNPDLATAIANSVVTAYEEIKEAEASQTFDSAIEEFNASIEAVDEELADITTQITELRAGGEEGNNVDAQIQTAIQQLLDVLAQDAVDQAQLQAALDQLQTLQLIQSLRGEDPALASLIESRNQALERRSQLALRRDQLRVDSAVSPAGISMISPAREAGQAVTLPRAILIGLLLGTVVGAVVAFAFASRSRRFQHRNEPELVLHAPLLAEVPQYREGRVSIPARDAPDTGAAEGYRLAEGSLDRLASAGTFTRIAGVVAAGAGDSATVTANLAVTAALRGKRVLAVDCNFGDPALARLLGAPETQEGITDIVEGRIALEEAVVPVDLGSGWTIDLLGKGRRTVTAPAFFHSRDTERFFAQLPEAYDLVLVDVPSPLQAAYAGAVIRLCEKTMVVVPHESEVAVLVDAMNQLALSGGKADGYVYTGSIQPSRPYSPESAEDRQGQRRRATRSSQG